MSAKLIYSLTDNENPDLEKHIGCMNGFFQLFDRHRRIAAHGHTHSQKRLPPPGKKVNQETEANSRLEKATGNDSKKVVKEKKRRNSTESSRQSFSSSSCSSSFSSLEYNKTAQPEPSPSSQNSSFSDTPTREFSLKPQTLKPVDLRDVIKDSMRRESKTLSVKITAKEIHTLKHIDSPRPLEPPKTTKPKTSSFNDSFRVFPKLREDRDGRTVRRLSYDGRESEDNLKTTVKLKELPRLSLDSRQGANKPSYVLTDLRIQRRSYGDESANLLQEPGSSNRASSVVAKLMGLVDPIPITGDSMEAEKHDLFLGSPRKSHKEVSSPRVRNVDSAARANANQKIPMETAPWRQQRGNRIRGFNRSESPPAKIATTPLTVYGEIEKRLADLEFKRSGKDLRALKQILEAMQKSKDGSDDKKNEKLASQASNHENQTLQSNSSITPRSPQGSNALDGNKSPIVIMKPGKINGRTLSPNPIDNSARHLTVRNARLTRIAQSSKTVEFDREESSGGLGRISGSTSPRLQQRRVMMEKQASPVSKRRQGGKQSSECNSPVRKYKPKSPHTLRIHDQLSDTRTEGNTNSLRSESLASEDFDNEVTSVYFDRNSKNQTHKKVKEAERATTEQPSPISVLDANFYRDESPSPVKKTSNAFKDDYIPYPDEMEWEVMDPMDHTITESFISESTNPDHIYISDILTASDLPRKLKHGWLNIKQNSSHGLINPKVFFSLENPASKPDETVHRQLIFDVVNEILARKLVVTDSFTQWLSPERPSRESRGQKLFRELCSGIDELRGSVDDGEEDSLRSVISNDMANWPMNWEQYGREIPAVVLDLERLIFKDLITELVNSEADRLHGGFSGHCSRKLF